MTHDFAIFKNNKYIYIQIFLVSKCNFIRNIYMKNLNYVYCTGLYLFFIKNELGIDSYYNRKKSKRLFKIIRDQTPLWLVAWTTKSIDIDLAANKYCKCVWYRHTMLIRPWHSLNINQFHFHSFVFNRRLVYFFKNSL